MEFPTNLLYSKSHEWVDFEDETSAVIGLTDYAQKELGDIVFINLPLVGDHIEEGEAFADVESVKAVSDVFSPVTAVISEINEELLDNPELINESPYESWLVKVDSISSKEELLSAEEYEEFIKSEEE